MQIRDITPADAADVVALWEESGLTRPWNPPASDLDRALAGSTSTVLGAFDDVGRLLGTVMVGHDGHRGWIYYLAVDERSRGAGHGRALVSAGEDWLRARGAVKVQLMVRSGNHDARGFYDALGYEHSDVSVLAKWLT